MRTTVSPTKHVLRVLLVEDCEDDASLILRLLRRGGFEPVWQRVETAEALEHALDTQQWDIILCDCVLPRLSALSALERIRRKGADVPVVIVSGEDFDDMPSILCGGAYVAKSHLVQLVPTVRRELRW